MVLDEHTQINIESVRGNHVPYMAKELSEAIVNRSRFKKKYLKWPM